jgi:preprotein translocase subunit SecD
VAAVRALARPVVSLTGVGASTLDVSGQGDTADRRLSEAERSATDDRTMQQSVEIVRRRVDEAGTREPTIQRQGADRILIQVPGIGSAQELKDLIGTTARLTFQPVVGRTDNADESVEPRQQVLPSMDEEGVFYILEQTPVVTGDDLTDAQPEFRPADRPAGGDLPLQPDRRAGLRRIHRRKCGRALRHRAGQRGDLGPRDPAGDHRRLGQISGNFTVEESSTELAVLLRAGALPAEMTFLEERTIGPELGADSIAAGELAALVAFAAVLVFMVLSYGLFGVFASVALILNVGLIFGVLSLIGATLTLPGIAGIVLTIGMAVDANVLVFERIREETEDRQGARPRDRAGLRKALSAIIDANITTFIIAVILFTLGSGPVRGFSVTLGIGILTSVFTAIFVTRLFIVTWFDRRRPKTIEV